MIYFDTSFLVPLFLEEPTSAAVEAFISSLPIGELATSHWTRVEFSSLLAREVRMDALSEVDARDTDTAFEETLRETFEILTPTIDDYHRAKLMLARSRTGLRAGDALHLAIASRAGIDVVYSLDNTMLKAAALLNMNVSAASVRL